MDEILVSHAKEEKELVEEEDLLKNSGNIVDGFTNHLAWYLLTYFWLSFQITGSNNTGHTLYIFFLFRLLFFSVIPVRYIIAPGLSVCLSVGLPELVDRQVLQDLNRHRVEIRYDTGRDGTRITQGWK